MIARMDPLSYHSGGRIQIDKAQLLLCEALGRPFEVLPLQRRLSEDGTPALFEILRHALMQNGEPGRAVGIAESGMPAAIFCRFSCA